MTTSLTIGSRFQGLTGIGQGGHLGGILAERLGGTVRVRFVAPIPLERALGITGDGASLVVWNDDVEVAAATRADIESDPPQPVDIESAGAAREWARARFLDGVTSCFSCGRGPRSFQVHAGLVPGSHAFASPFTPPPWTADDQGLVRLRYLWAPLDCAAGWRVTLGGESRPAVTGWLTVQVVSGVEPGTDLVVVADATPNWNGRKRAARSAIYTKGGNLVARSESLWISLPPTS